MVPPLLTELAFVPKPFDQLDRKIRMLRHQNSYDIVSIFHIPNAKNAAVNLCCPRDLLLFAQINIRDHRRAFIRPPRLDLNKTKHVAIKRDQIDLTRDLNALAVASDRNFEI